MSENNEIKEPSNKNNKVPRLRFREFKNDWHKIAIKNIAVNENHSFTGGPFGSNLKTNDYTSEGVRVIQLNNIYDVFFNDTNKVFVSEKKAESLKYCNAFPGDLIFAKMMPAGRVCVLPNLYKKYLLGSDAIRLKLNALRYDSFFIIENLNRSIIRNNINSRTAGSTRQRIGLSELKKTSFYCPHLVEQKKIGFFFQEIERKIKIIERKIDILKKYKEGIIKNLVNRSNKHVRFLNLISLYDKTRLPSSIGKESGKYKFFINSSNEETKWSDDYIFDGEYIIMNTGGSAYTNYINGKFSAMSDCLIIKPQNRYSIALYYWLKAKERMIDKVGFQGTGLKHLDLNWLLRKNISLIEYNNKKLIKLNASLDYLINLNSLMLAKLIRVKKGLLDTMFI